MLDLELTPIVRVLDSRKKKFISRLKQLRRWSVATLHRTLDLGINFWDTADVYGNGANEELISKVLVKNFIR